MHNSALGGARQDTTVLEMRTGDFELLDCFVALIFNFDFDWDCLPVEIELQSRTRQVESVKVAKIWDSRGTRIRRFCHCTSLSSEASTWTGLSDIIKFLQISALGPAPT